MGRYDAAVAVLDTAEATFDKVPTATITDPVDPQWARREDGLWFDKSLIFTLAGDVRRANEAHDNLLRRDFGLTTNLLVQLHRTVLQARTDPEQGAREAARITLEVISRQAAALPAARELRELASLT